MKIDNIDFNESFWKGKSKAEFIAHESHHGLSEKQLEEAFDLLNPDSSESQDPSEDFQPDDE
jgi:hypothetical protein